MRKLAYKIAKRNGQDVFCVILAIVVIAVALLSQSGDGQLGVGAIVGTIIVAGIASIISGLIISSIIGFVLRITENEQEKEERERDDRINKRFIKDLDDYKKHRRSDAYLMSKYMKNPSLLHDGNK